MSVLGCVVNGIGEGKEADIGIAGGQGMGILFKKGKLVKKVPSEQLMDVLIEEVELMALEQNDSREENSSSSDASQAAAPSDTPIANFPYCPHASSRSPETGFLDGVESPRGFLVRVRGPRYNTVRAPYPSG